MMAGSRPRARALAATLPAALLCLGWSVTGSVGPALAADDGTCVGHGEYKNITSGMNITKLQLAVHGQVPFAETSGRGKQRYRWYVACDAWKPDVDVAVRVHEPVVGRRTVTKKSLDVYVA
jgi:hypothetical protein